MIGRRVRQFLPDEQLSAETRDTVKLTVGLVGTMTALLLGMLVSSAKDSYDGQRTHVIQMAAKVSVLDRILTLYGPVASDVRKEFHYAVEDSIARLWPQEKGARADLAPNEETAHSVYFKIEGLSPTNETQQKLKAAAETTAVSLAELRALLVAQSEPSISFPMLAIVISWLMIIFVSFSLLAPANATANLSLLISSFAVAGAIFLLLELDQPFSGVIRISNQEMVDTLAKLPK